MDAAENDGLKSIVPVSPKNPNAPKAILFLSDLSLNSSSLGIESLFQDFGDVLSVKIYQDFLISFGYVEMENVVEAFRAIDCLQGTLYIDRPLK